MGGEGGRVKPTPRNTKCYSDFCRYKYSHLDLVYRVSFPYFQNRTQVENSSQQVEVLLESTNRRA